MVFTSPAFLYVFLPLVLMLYFGSPGRFRNGVLLAASLLFYAWGEAVFVLLLVLSLAINYGVARGLERARGSSARSGWLGLGVGLNLLMLWTFKYANFAVDNLNEALSLLGLSPLELAPVHLPLGISFYTFQALSFLVDIYRGDATVPRRPVDAALYIALFPQLIAGPIVRFSHLAPQLERRIHSFVLFRNGVQRFVFGLAKKVLIANPLGFVVDEIHARPVDELTTALAWLAMGCFTLQIYFDFSGYSDMAIGLGRMFGFRFNENFNYPHAARSVRDFWQRWHISLSTWFRDYLYIPLGGNRAGRARTTLNLLAVFLLCGLWHGASWNFAVWGLFHGGFLALERTRFGGRMARLPALLQHLYTMAVVAIGLVFFRSDDLSTAWVHLASIAGFAPGDGTRHYVAAYTDNRMLLCFAAAVLLSTPIMRRVNRRLLALAAAQPVGFAFYSVGNLLLVASLALLCAMSGAAKSYDPFIYFRF